MGTSQQEEAASLDDDSFSIGDSGLSPARAETREEVTAPKKRRGSEPASPEKKKRTSEKCEGLRLLDVGSGRDAFVKEDYFESPANWEDEVAPEPKRIAALLKVARNKRPLPTNCPPRFSTIKARRRFGSVIAGRRYMIVGGDTSRVALTFAQKTQCDSLLRRLQQDKIDLGSELKKLIPEGVAEEEYSDEIDTTTDLMHRWAKEAYVSLRMHTADDAEGAAVVFWLVKFVLRLNRNMHERRMPRGKKDRTEMTFASHREILSCQFQDTIAVAVASMDTPPATLAPVTPVV
jgi:hypothetical protein